MDTAGILCKFQRYGFGHQQMNLAVGTIHMKKGEKGA